jgi:hypothetical protein
LCNARGANNGRGDLVRGTIGMAQRVDAGAMPAAVRIIAAIRGAIPSLEPGQ